MGAPETDRLDRRATRAHWLAFALVLVACGALRLDFLRRTSPYPLHEDEGYLTRAAARMVREGDPNPRFFRYPSLPIYLTAGAFLAGLALEGDPGGPVGAVTPPFYTRPRVVGAARVLFVLLSVGAAGLAAVAAWRAFGEPALLVVAPLVLGLSDRYQLQSWAYLNVDIVGAFVCAAATAVLFRFRERGSALHRALLPGLLVGCAVGSKYYLGLVGLPFALVLLAPAHRPRLARNAVLIAGATVAGFLLTTPYALLDREAFASELEREVRHYHEGHEGGEGEPGWPQLLYYLGQLRGEFGSASLAFALVGVAWGLRRRRAATALWLAFPLALLAFLCAQRVHFPRNLTALYALFPGLAGLGGVVAARALSPVARRIAGRGGPVLAAAVVAGVAAPFLPWRVAVRAWSVPVDSRSAAAAWIAQHVADGRPVVVAAELQMDTSGLAARHPVVEAPLGEIAARQARGAFADPADPASRGPVFLLTTLGEGSRLERTYGAAVAPLDALVERARWGANGVPRVRTRMIHMGDPRLAVFELPAGTGG